MLDIELDTMTTVSSNTTSSTSTATAAKTKFSDRLRTASRAVKDGDYVTAIRLYTDALKLDTQHNHVLYGNRSAAYCRIGKFSRALQDAIKARELNPNWSKAYYRQGIALQCLGRHSDALAAFASGLTKDSKSVLLLSGFVETAMKSPLRATLEPTYCQLQAMNFDKSPFVITSVVGQELLAAGHYAAAVVVLESALKIGSCSLKLRGSVFSALSSAYWALNNIEKAITFMQQDVQVAKSLGDSLGECRAHGNLGSAYFAKFNYKEALASHRYQLVLSIKAKHTQQSALALTSLGHVYSAIGDINNALASHKQCLTLVRQIGDPLAEAREIGNVGAACLAAGDFQTAIEYHLEHVKLAKLLGNKCEEARAYSNLGSAHHYRRNYSQAIQFHEQVLRISQEIGDRAIEAKAFAGLGHASRCMGDMIQAKRWHERQLDIALVMKDKLGEGRACSNLGIVYQLLGDYDGALKLHWCHLTISKLLNDCAGMGRAYGNIGNAYSSLRQYSDAIKYHKQVLHISKSVHDRGAEASTHGNLAVAYQALNVFDVALTHYHLHLNVAKEMKDCNSEACALSNLGNYHSVRNEFEKAISYYDQYLELTQSIGDRTGEAKAYHFLGYAYYNLNNYDKAIEYYEQDLQISREMQDRVNMGRAYCNIGLAHSALGNYKEALECQKYFLCTSQSNACNKLRAMSNIGDVLLLMKQSSDATKMFEKQLLFARTTANAINEANALRSLGNCHKSIENYDKAILYYKKELMLRQSCGDINGEVDALGNLGEIHFKCNNYSSALKCFMDQLDKSAHVVNDGNKCRIMALENVATTRVSMSHYDEAIGYFKQELELLAHNHTSIKSRKERTARCHRNVGQCYQSLSDYEEAIKCYVNYLSFSDCSIEDQELAYESLGKCYHLLNNLSQALVSYEKRLVLAHELGCNRRKAIAYGELGEIHSQLDNLEQAITCFKHEQELAKDVSVKNGAIEAEALHGLGCVSQKMHDYERALKYHSSALVIAQELSSLQLECRSYGAIGSSYQALGNNESAIKYLEKYLSVAHIIGDRLAQVSALSSLGRMHWCSDEFAQAINYLEQALAIVEQLGSKREQEANICHDLGMALWSISDLEGARVHLQRSVDLFDGKFQQMRDQRIGINGGVWESGVQSATYNALCKVLIALNRCSDALIIAERSRNRRSNKEKQGFRVSQITSDQQIVEISKSQNAAILYYSCADDGVFYSWLVTPNGIKFTTISSDSLAPLLSSVLESIQTESQYNDDTSSHDSLTLRSHLNRNHYLNSSNYSLSSIFSLASSVASNATHTSTTISSPHTSHTSTNGWHCPSLSSLYQLLIPQSFSEQLSREPSLTHMRVVLDGDLYLVPWNVLKSSSDNTSGYLYERYSLLVLPSLQSLRCDQRTKSLRKSASSSTMTSLVVANPMLPNNVCSDNPLSEREASLVGELLSTRPLIGCDANKEAVLQQLSSAQCIHLSSHFVDNSNGDNSLLMTSSGIALSSSDTVLHSTDQSSQISSTVESLNSDYLLTPQDFLTIGLSAKLVVISCCDTLSSYQSVNHNTSSQHKSTDNTDNTDNTYQTYHTLCRSESVRTLVWSILGSGAQCVLITLWSVPLCSLQILYRVFYSSLLCGTRVSEALNEAISTIQNTEHFSHPNYWSGFLLIGSDIRLSSQVALMSSSLASLLKSHDRSREALRVILHLVEKSLLRIQRGFKNAMYTTLQSIENKIGLSVNGWRELLISVGFRFEPQSNNGLPASVFFPQSDPNHRLRDCSSTLQAILALSSQTINSISKLLANSESVLNIIEQLKNLVSQNNCSQIDTLSSLPPIVETIPLLLWSTPGCHELFASLGFDLMEVGSNSVKLRTGKNANKRTIAFALQALLAVFDNNDNSSNNTNDNSNEDSEECSSDEIISSDEDVSRTKCDTSNGVINNAFSMCYERGEPDGQHNGQKTSNGSSSNSAYTPSPVVTTKVMHNNNNTHNTLTISDTVVKPINVNNNDSITDRINGIKCIAKRCESSSSTTGSITDWDSGHTTVHRRADYISRKQLEISFANTIDSMAL